MASVVFDYALWTERFPELASVSQTLAQMFFDEACLNLNNGDGSIVTDLSERRVLLYLLTAHIAVLNSPNRRELAGRVQQATQGTVNVSTEAMNAPFTAAWYVQTPYGLDYWQKTAKYRTARYVAPRPSVNRLWPFLQR